MDDIGLIGGLVLYAPLGIALVVGTLLLIYAARRRKYWVGAIGTGVILIFLSIYFYQWLKHSPTTNR
jgi:ABC-type dipeptide/oligopeptide/nickel transport system permease component